MNQKAIAFSKSGQRGIPGAEFQQEFHSICKLAAGLNVSKGKSLDRLQWAGPWKGNPMASHPSKGLFPDSLYKDGENVHPFPNPTLPPDCVGCPGPSTWRWRWREAGGWRFESAVHWAAVPQVRSWAAPHTLRMG